jgi:UDP-N-acetylmuramoyl-L-alanyl-D-glutamate--2,6-diaminopimelate ligase
MKQTFKDRTPQWMKNQYHLLQAIVANVWFGFPSRKLKVIGVTGTNGKTTTTRLISAILEAAGHRVARASTIDFQIGEKHWVNTTKYTTLSAWSVQKFLRRAVRAQCEYVVLETSSHALDQKRVWGVRYQTAVVTNMTREHLDYHKTMEAYAKTKAQLFAMAKKAIVNADMEYAELFLAPKQLKERSTYSTLDPQANVLAEQIVLTSTGSTCIVDGIAFELHLPGQFNIENALAAIAVGVSEGIPLQTSAEALKKIAGIPGRMEYVANTRGISILIDYAVTPDSLEKLYELVTRGKKTTSKIIAVFGSCGERDRGKRPIMGEIVSSFADVVILTNEDPYREDPRRIIKEISKGVRGKTRGKNYFHILDRRAALAKALKLAQPGDTIVVTGKGAEETMALGNKRIPWNDRSVIEELLNPQAGVKD